jgi:GNAT superfamily N-acetyltransferase
VAGEELRIEPVRDLEGTERSLRLHNETLPSRAATLEEVLGYQEGLADHLDTVAYFGDEPAGSAFAAIEPHQRDGDVVHLILTVPFRFRRRGVGTALYRSVSAWALDRGRSELESWVYDQDQAGRAFALRQGLVEVVRDARVGLDLAGLDPPPVEPPAGIEIVTWAERPDLGPGLYEVELEAQPDIPGQEDEPLPSYDDWLRHHMGGPSDRPEATFVALAGDDLVVGFAKFHFPGALPAVAWHDLTGVKRAWRGRGIARALKHAQIAWAKQQGYERLETANEVRNEPIRRLNEQLGYRPISGRVLMRGPISG